MLNRQTRAPGAFAPSSSPVPTVATVDRLRPLLHLVLGTLLASVAACGGTTDEALDVSLDASSFATTDWETGFDESDFTAWYTGEVLDVPIGPLPDLSTLDPVIGARVDLVVPRPDGLLPLRVIATAATDAEGRYRVGPAPNGLWLVRVAKDGYATGLGGEAPRVFGAIRLPAGDAQFGIRRGYDVTLRLDDGSGGPLPGMRVRAQTLAYFEEATTDETGSARFFAPAGPVEFTTIDGSRRGASVTVDVVEAQASLAQTFDLSAPEIVPLTGWVIDAESGRPLSGAVVLSLTRPEIRTVTGDDGRYELPVQRVGAVAAFGRGRGWSSQAVPKAGELEFRLARAFPVTTGHVVGPDGAPVAGARIVACARRADGMLERVLGPVTGADGSFSFDWCPAPPRGMEAEIVISAYRRGFAWSAGAELEAPGGEVTLALGNLRSITGVVTRASGAASPGVQVNVSMEPQNMTTHQAAALGMRLSHSVRGAPDGTFEIGAVPGRSGIVTFRVAGARFERRLAAGGDARETLSLEGGESISGRIVDVHGEPVATGGVVSVSALNHPEFSNLKRSVEVAEDGTFRVDDLPPGTYGVRARSPTYDVGGTVVESGTSDVELVAERPTGLTFELVYPEGAERIPVVVQLLDADDPSARARTVRIVPDSETAEGTIGIVRRGNYHVVARGGALRAHVRDMVIPDGDRPPIQLALTSTKVRNLRLEDRDGAALSGRRVRVARLDRRGGKPETFFTGESGEVEISGLSDGEWQARVLEFGKPIAQERFTVGEGLAADILLRIPPYGSVVVQLDRSAPGARDAVVALESAEGGVVYGWVNGKAALSARFRVPAKGDLVIRGVPAVAITVVVEHGSGEPTRRSVRVEDGGQVTVRVP